ncbi:MAG TPA: hypothetical protein VG323_05840 [Thermoanaerobaculia bacterium]|nr:hypothetical protein [Thermoanaerobaculia bacterium]
MPSDLFVRSESELDALLDAARSDLERRGIGIADGSAREAEVWAFSFSSEREIGIERQRTACTLTLRGETSLMMQSIATGSRLQHRDSTAVSWAELRRRGMAAVVEDALASAQYRLQVKIGVDFAHQELIRRCESLIDLIGDDLVNAPALREQVARWKSLAEERTLYSAARPKLLGRLDFGHLQDDANALEEFYEANIYAPLSSRPPFPAPAPAPAPAPDDNAIPRRVALLDKIPKMPVESEATKAMLILGIAMAVAAVALIAFAVVRHSWPLGIGGAVFLLLVVRALRQWHA